MEEITLDVFGVQAHVTTPAHDFAEFVCQNYRFFLDGSNRTRDIVVTYSPDAGDRAVEEGHTLYRAGKGIYVGRKKLYWENVFGFRVLLTLTDAGGFDILAFHHDLLRQQSLEERYQNFQRSMRWAIHFPIFVLLRERLGWVLVHASAVARGNEALVFCGLNKVGKSTLAMHLCQAGGYSFMTDNFLLAGPQWVYGFPEVVRMPPEAMERLGLQFTKPHTIYGKYHISLDSNSVCLKARPQTCFLVTNGEKLELVRLNPAHAWRTVEGMHAFLGEFPESSYLALLPFLGQGSFDDRPNLPMIFHDATWFHLSFPLDWNLESIMEVIEGCI